MSDFDGEALCAVCNKSNARLCGRCISIRYCSEKCQRDDWATHKLLCRAFSRFDVSNRPSKDHYRAIFFPVDEKKPRLVWLQCKWGENEQGRVYRFVDTDPFIGSFSGTQKIERNPILKGEPSGRIYICDQINSDFEGGSNKSIEAITATQPGQHQYWRGPNLTYGSNDFGVGTVAWRDLDMKDFRHITNYFLSYLYNMLNPEPAANTQQPIDEKVQGVRINCLGDQKMLNKPPFEAVEISLTDSIFSEHDIPGIAQRIRLPIFTKRCPPDPKWATDQNNELFSGHSPFNNQHAAFLHLCCDLKYDDDPNALALGGVPWQWHSGVGSAIVVRRNKKPLFPLHVEALCRYSRYEVQPLLDYCTREFTTEEPVEQGPVLAMICRPTFVIYWYKLLEEKRKEGQGTDVPFPYYDVFPNISGIKD